MSSRQKRKSPRRSKRISKYKLLLDEGLSPNKSYPNLNRIHKLTHIGQDNKLGGMKDPAIYTYAKQHGMLVMVLNTKDFRPLVQVNGPTVIVLSNNIPNSQVDKKICKLLKEINSKEKFGHIFSVSNEGIKTAKVGEKLQ